MNLANGKSGLKPHITRLPRPALRFVALLGIWFGLTLVAACGLFWILGSYWVLTHDPRLARLNPHARLSIIEYFAQFWLGIGVLLASIQLLKWGDSQEPPEINASGRVRENIRGYIRAVLHPTSDDLLHFWSIHFDFSPDELQEKLATLQQFPALSYFNFLTLDGKLPAARIRKDKIVIAVTGAHARYSQWRGVLSSDGQGKAVLTGQVENQSRFMTLHLQFFNIFWNVIMLLFLVISFLLFLSGQFLPLPLVLLMHGFKVANDRALRHGIRQHERQLEPFFRNQLDATEIDLKNRYEIFSLGWWRIFRRNR